MECLTVLQTAHLSGKKPQGTMDQRQRSAAKWFRISRKDHAQLCKCLTCKKHKNLKKNKKNLLNTQDTILQTKSINTNSWCEKTSGTQSFSAQLWSPLLAYTSLVVTHSEKYIMKTMSTQAFVSYSDAAACFLFTPLSVLPHYSITM